MAEPTAIDLEASVKQLPGVLGCVILTHPESGRPGEIQAFVRTGVDQEEVQSAIRERAAELGFDQHIREILVFELQAESHLSDWESLQRAAEVAEQEARARGLDPAPPSQPDHPPAGGRPEMGRVVLTSTMWHSEAEVALGPEGQQVLGQASGDKTPHGLQVLAQATLDAASRLAGGTQIELKGASLVDVFGREAVLVVVQVEDSKETLGAALLRDGPVSEAAVRATLDALNRRLPLGP